MQVIIGSNTIPEAIIVGGTGPPGPPGPPGTGINTVVPLTVSGDISGHRILSSSGLGLAYYTDVTNTQDIKSIVGMSSSSSLALGTVDIIVSGIITEPSWNWVAYEPIYLTGLGFLTQIVPTAGYLVQIGTPIAPTQILLDIRPAIFLI
jgi:hypothetical protein